MGVRDLFSTLKKKVKHLGRKRKPDRPGGSAHGETIDTVNPPPRPEPQIEAGNGADEGGQQASPTDRPPQLGEPELVPAIGNKNDQEEGETKTDQVQQPDEPEPVPAGRSEDGQGGREAGVDGGEVNQSYSHPHPSVEVAVGSGPRREGNDVKGERVERVYPPSPTPPIPRNRKPDGMWMWISPLLTLIVPLDNTDTNTPGCVPEILPSKLLQGVRDSGNGLSSLKSIAGGLCLVLDNCKAWSPSHELGFQSTYSHPSKQG